MPAIRKTILEAVLLSVIAFAVAAGANAVRPKGALKWNKDHFPKRRLHVEQKQELYGNNETEQIAEQTGDQPKHDYQTITFEELEEIFNDPDPETGAVVFVDARNDAAFEAGHIPGAIQCDRYYLEDYIEDVLDYAYDADQVIVYCNGGECEDSMYLCGELMEFDVPYESLYLYEGGWKEWMDHDMPVATGRGEEAEEEAGESGR